MTDASPFRLPAPDGLLIDRARSLRFSFEGRQFTGYAGDTVASALAAHGVSLLSRSFKYRRPRGLFSLAGAEANTLVEVNGEANVLAEQHAVAEGDRVRGQNYTGSLAFDRGAWIGALGRFLPVGFYYRAFFRPRGAWRFWEPIVRRRAGIGRVDTTAPRGYFDKAYLFADVAVVGGGPAGLAAAIAAAEAGGRVVLIDENPVLGGALAYARFDPEGRLARARREALTSRLAALRNVRVLTDATCQGCFADNWLPVVRGNRLYKLRAGRVVVATGAFEQPLVFRHNDLPGIMLGSAAQRLIRLYGVRPGHRAVIATANDDGYATALDLLEAGGEVVAVADLRREPAPTAMSATVARAGVPIWTGHTLREAAGRRRVAAVELAPVRDDRRCGASSASLACDLVCISVGYAPNLALAAHAGARLAYDPGTAMHRATNLPPGLDVAGAANQVFALDPVLADGARAGRAATGRAAEPVRDPGAAGITHPWPIFPDAKGKDFVDFDEDLTVQDILDSVAAGFDDIQLLKRYSTLGMGPSQGRHSAANAIRLAARALDRTPDQIGTTTSRPPYAAERIGVLAGRSFEPVRRTPMHHRHAEAGARMMVAAAWLRPAHYGGSGDAEAAIAGEARAVRASAGLIDVSTLGKIEIRGPDAGEFLDRLYVTAHGKQPIGRGRYALLTDAAGTIVDDGVVCRLADTHYYVTATTSGVDAVVRDMYLWNAQWRLDVDIANVTAAYAAVNLAGPRSRAVLAAAGTDLDLGPEAFPFMGVRTGLVAGIPARTLRVGFVGELGYEIHVPAGCGEALWDALLAAGRAHGIRPFGVEAQRVLRLEKGHIIVGQDTDGLTYPDEFGRGAMGARKPFFVGGPALRIHRTRAVSRQLVGFTLDDSAAPLPKECHLVIRDGEIAGRVTSCVRSPNLGKPIGLAYVAPSQAPVGSTFEIRVEGRRLVRARVVALPFYDPENHRQAI